MTTLKPPVDLDFLVTKITPRYVHYDLFRGRQSEHFKLPSCSTFNPFSLEVGKRYQVLKEDQPIVRSLEWCPIAQQQVYRDRYDWARVREVPPLAKCAARSNVQRKMAESLAAHPIVESANELFNWGSK